MIYGWPLFSSLATSVNSDNYNINNLSRLSDEILIKKNIIKQRIVLQKLRYKFFLLEIKKYF